MIATQLSPEQLNQAIQQLPAPELKPQVPVIPGNEDRQRAALGTVNMDALTESTDAPLPPLEQAPRASLHRRVFHLGRLSIGDSSRRERTRATADLIKKLTAPAEVVEAPVLDDAALAANQAILHGHRALRLAGIEPITAEDMTQSKSHAAAAPTERPAWDQKRGAWHALQSTKDGA